MKTPNKKKRRSKSHDRRQSGRNLKGLDWVNFSWRSWRRSAPFTAIYLATASVGPEEVGMVVTFRLSPASWHQCPPGLSVK